MHSIITVSVLVLVAMIGASQANDAPPTGDDQSWGQPQYQHQQPNMAMGGSESTMMMMVSRRGICDSIINSHLSLLGHDDDAEGRRR